MLTLTVAKAKIQLLKLLDTVVSSRKPIQIVGKRANAILVSEEAWRSIQETLYLLSIPGMRQIIRKGVKTPFKECAEELRW